MKRYAIPCLILLLVANSDAKTTTLPECSQTTVQSAINSALDGDVLLCPAGSWSWSNVDITKNITLQGAGIGDTNITITANKGIESPYSYTGAFRLTGFTFIENGNYGGDYDGAMLYIQRNKNFRVDHNEFQIYGDGSITGGAAVHVKYDAYGLFDNNRFIAGLGPGCSHAAIQTSNSGTSSTALNDQKYSWLNFDSNEALSDPTKAIVVEDNYFYNPDDCDSHNVHAVYMRHGAVVVFRFNEVHMMNFDNHGMRAEHAGFAFEVSNNRWVQDVPGNDLYNMINVRGGTGVIYGNSRTGSSSTTYGVYLWYERATSSSGSSSITMNVPGNGTVTASSTCASTEGYPCAQQPGMGKGNARDPVYIWNNTNFPPLRNATGESWMQSERDYFLDRGAKPGYVAYPYPHPLASGATTLPLPQPTENLVPRPPAGLQVSQ